MARTTDAPAAELAGAALAVARRFAAGATMWCVAPEFPAHARHVAVEFVHPVVVGKRALPALAVEGPDLVAALRTSVRPGDILVAIATAREPVVPDLIQRAAAWGALTVWIGVGDRPETVPDHLLWTEGADPLLAHSGRAVLTYHVLWEMTHVCFEHPGLLDVAEGPGRDEVCITCSDEGRLAEVRQVLADGMTLVRTADGDEEVDTTLVGPVAVGDLVLVHAGTALAPVDNPGRRP